MKKTNCPNCGAPIDVFAGECEYCNTKFHEKKEQKVESKVESSHYSGFDHEGCMRTMLSLGLIFLIRGAGPRRPPRRRY